jgi:hypothetical protein
MLMLTRRHAVPGAHIDGISVSCAAKGSFFLLLALIAIFNALSWCECRV